MSLVYTKGSFRKGGQWLAPCITVQNDLPDTSLGKETGGNGTGSTHQNHVYVVPIRY